MSNQNLINLTLISLLIIYSNAQICHYTCLTCSGSQYYQCSSCPTNRGNAGIPFAGMCYCSQGADQNDIGNCVSSDAYNHNNKSLILSFIGLAVTFSIITTMIRGSKYFLLKIIQDVQQLSLIVFINLYFPQQFDPFMAGLYRFNISSYTFQAMTSGSLFLVDQKQGVESLDGTNIYGNSNFFSNQFTWLIVFTCIFVFMIGIKYLSKYFMQNDSKQKIQQIRNDSQVNMDHNGVQQVISTQVLKVSQQQRNWKEFNLKNALIKLNNILWLNFLIFFFYFSLIEININVFTQISNLTFSSSFAATGAFFSAFFLGLQIALIALLVLKSKQQMIKPAWMRDYTFTAPIYLVRTNYKTLTKYFFFFSCIKKVLLAMMITILYSNPAGSIVGLSAVQLIYICIAIYCQPFERRYMRLHFYFTEGLKLFIYVSLINFTQKYVQYVQLIDITKILFQMLAFVFGFHFVCIIINILIQKDAYWSQIKRKLELNGFCKDFLSQTCKDQSRQDIEKQQKINEEFQRSKNRQQKDIIGYVSEEILYYYKNQQDFQEKAFKKSQKDIQIKSIGFSSIK